MTQVVSFECYRWYHLSDIITPSSVSETKANIKLETMKLGGTFNANVAE